MAYKDKYAKVVDRLFENTEMGSLVWQDGSFSDETYKCDFGANSLSIRPGTNDKGEPTVEISVLNNFGRDLDTFSDETFRGMVPGVQGYQDYWTLMSELLQMARRSGTGADKVIDDILKQLDSK